MRVASWTPTRWDETFENVAIERLVDGAEIIAGAARRKCPVGTISRPAAGKLWTSRDPRRLKKSIRVVRKKTKSGRAFTKKRNVRVYAGHYLAFYARFVEYGTVKTSAKPFMRPALSGSAAAVKAAVGAI